MLAVIYLMVLRPAIHYPTGRFPFTVLRVVSESKTYSDEMLPFFTNGNSLKWTLNGRDSLPERLK